MDRRDFAKSFVASMILAASQKLIPTQFLEDDLPGLTFVTTVVEFKEDYDRNYYNIVRYEWYSGEGKPVHNCKEGYRIQRSITMEKGQLDFFEKNFMSNYKVGDEIFSNHKMSFFDGATYNGKTEISL